MAQEFFKNVRIRMSICWREIKFFWRSWNENQMNPISFMYVRILDFISNDKFGPNDRIGFSIKLSSSP